MRTARNPARIHVDAKEPADQCPIDADLDLVELDKLAAQT
jgi:hypothetical protein